jgi:2-oxoglutarate dehydrogenase E2 component (dihydrolipoamide succinyltransferase)
MEMDRMRKIIAENMAYSKHVSPHVTSFVEADVTHMVMWRERNKAAFEKKYNEKLTYTPLFVEALVKAIRDFPMVNVSVDGDKILVKKDVNISLAVALPSGNLIVPTLRNADRLSLAGLAAAVNDLTDRARKNKLSPNDIADGTYTLSNVGTFGNVMGTPIIMQPQAAVLAVGAIRKKPAVVETPTGDVIAIRHMMFLSHSYDHRIIDGMLGGSFVRRVADYLESFDIQREV